MVLVFHVVRPISTVQYLVELNPELTQEFEPGANSTRTLLFNNPYIYIH